MYLFETFGFPIRRVSLKKLIDEIVTLVER